MAEQFANNASSTLNGAINNSTTTIVVTSATPFPTIGNFRLLIGTNPLTAEIVLVTGVSGTTFTVVRGQENTAASSWPDLTTVTHILTAGAVEQIRTQFTSDGSTEMYTTRTVSIDGNGTLASTHGTGTSKLYVNGNVLGTSFSAGEVPYTTRGFGYVSDALQAFTVPAGVTSLKVKMWGPGGGSGNYGTAGGAGAGGYTTGFLSVTPGEILYLAVGSGGNRPASTTGNGGAGGWPGGGFGTRGDASGGGGGGASAIFTTNAITQANALMVAGGGGGATGFGNFGAGGGGGLTGGSGTDTSGKGGSQIGPGANGNNVGAQTTTIASGSNGQSLPQSTINVVSTTNFPTIGTIYVTTSAGVQVVTYTGTTGTSFTGASGGTGTMSTGGGVSTGGTTIASGSNGASLPQSTINVGSTGGFPSSGTLVVVTSNGNQLVQYTGTTSTTFTGATGGTGTMSTGNMVRLASAGGVFAGGVAYVDFTSSQPTGNDDGGGGSGYFGGGSGMNDGRAGGGGSGYIHPTRVTSGSTTAGANNPGGTASASPPATTDIHYIAGIGVGGAASGSGNDGGDGYVYFVWGGITTFDLDSIDFGNTSSISIVDTNLSIASALGGTITLAPGNGIITLQGTTDPILSSGTANLVFNANSAQKFKIYASGAIVTGTDAVNDTSAEAQSGLTGPLINMSPITGGTITSAANQALLFNNAGFGTIQGHNGVTFRVSTAVAGHFDSNSILRIGPNNSSTTTIHGASSPFVGSDYLWMYSTGSAWGEIISGGTVNRAAFQILNNGAGGSATSGVALMAGGTSHSTPEYAGMGTIEQSGASTSGLIFTKLLGNGTGFASTGAIWQSGAWAIGRSTQNDTSTEAQAGLTGPLLNLTQITGGSLTSTANQSLLYNNAGTVTLQGHVGHTLIANTTTIASTSTSKFITNVGRRIATNVRTANYTVQTTDEVIIVGALSSSITITLPTSPTAGDTYTVKDQGGTSATFNIIISGNGNNIDGVTSYTMNTNYESVTVVFANGSWSII